MLSSIYEVEDKDNYYTRQCIHCETCGDDEIKPHECHESSDKCGVCHNRNCLNSFEEDDIKVDDLGEWHCPACQSTHVMIHERCQCDEPTASGTVYQVHDEDGNANCWPTYGHNRDEKVFECTKCREQFPIGLHDSTEETEEYYATRCITCNSKELVVKDVKSGDAYPPKIVEWHDD